jgi:hypothetical protein
MGITIGNQNNVNVTGNGVYQTDPFIISQAAAEPNPNYCSFRIDVTSNGFISILYDISSSIGESSECGITIPGVGGYWLYQTDPSVPHPYIDLWVEVTAGTVLIFNTESSGGSYAYIGFYSPSANCFNGWENGNEATTTTWSTNAVITSTNGIYLDDNNPNLLKLTGGLNTNPYCISFYNNSAWTNYGLTVGDSITINNFSVGGGTGFFDISGTYYVIGLTTILGIPFVQLACEASPSAPISLKIFQQPQFSVSGDPLSVQPVVGIVDQADTLLPSYSTDVEATLVVLSGSATLTGTTLVSTVDGIATFTDLVITGNGLFYIHFESKILLINHADSNQMYPQPDPGNPNPPIPVKPKRSYIAGSVPAYTDLEINEFAINVADRKGYMRDSNDIVHLLFDGYATGGGGSGGTVYSVGVSSQDLTVTNSPITTSGFIGLELNTQSITAGAYGDGSNVAEVTVNDKGIVTGIQNVAISYPVNSITAGTDISLTGTAPDYTINNTAPDQIVSLTSGTGVSVTGTYPDFTIDCTITQYTDADARLSLSAGTGISYENTTGVITNEAPDQTVSLTGGTDISVTGTYPNFTIDYTGTAGSGTVTSVGITTTSTALTISNSPITTSGDIGVNFSGKGSEYVTGDGSLKTFPTTIDQALNLVTEVYNSTGSTLTKGTVVYINGGQGNLPTVTKAQANNDANSAQTYGIIQSDISDQDNGYVVVSGRLTDIDTQSYSPGTQLYLSPTTAGAWTTTKPSAPSHLVYVGIVVYQHPTQGVVEVKIQNGYELHELHDVSITSVAPNNILRYNSSTKLWENVAGTTSSISEGSNLYYTDARVRLALSAGTGITYDNSTGKITNSSPDQTVVLTAGTGISTSGTYPSFTITNASPDQTVTLTAGTGIGVTGTYPSFTISSTITQYTDSDARKSLSAGTGITYDNTTGIITNADPDQVVSLTAGTSISISGTYPSFTITNDDPDQIVSLTGGTDISITGTYPSFTIDYIGTPGTGTVTSITAGSYLTGGTITTSGTIDVDATSSNTASTVVARDGSGNFSAGTITASLTGNASSSTNLANGGAGQIPYNTGSGATSFLAAGTSGQILRSNGTSAPSWETQGIFSSGRLTLESGVPVSTTDQTSKTTIYYTPYNGDKISLYDGTNWATYTFTQRSLSLGTLTSGKNYDVFLYNNAGTLTLELTAWTNDTTRATSLTMTNGVYLKTGALTRRYLGTIRTTSTTTTEDSANKRLVWNFNNRVSKNIYVADATGNWVYSTAAWRYANNNSNNKIEFVAGIALDSVSCNLTVTTYATTAIVAYYPSAALNTTSGIPTYTSSGQAYVSGTLSWFAQRHSNMSSMPQTGYNYIAWLEYSGGATGTINVSGANDASKMVGTWIC